MKKLLLILVLGTLTSGLFAQESDGMASKMQLSPDFDKGVTLSLDKLKTYEGTYELMPNFNLKFFVKGDQLVSQATGQEVHALVPQGNDIFTLTAFPARITFIKDEDGTFNSMMLSQSGSDMIAPKIE